MKPNDMVTNACEAAIRFVCHALNLMVWCVSGNVCLQIVLMVMMMITTFRFLNVICDYSQIGLDCGAIMRKLSLC